ncbi:MAG: acyltransferase [Bacteroidaceae bacterium]|nr:acyltransferase [Bacteroidaceae bacterium]
MKEERIVFLDYLRIFACFLVMMVHASEAFYGVGETPILSESHKLWIAIWDGMSRISVPLFVITSAYLLVPMSGAQSWSDFFKRRFLRIIPPMAVFMVIYALLSVWQEGWTWKDAFVALCQLPLNFPMNAFHLWFMYPLIGLYLLIPILSPWLRVATAKQERIFLYLWTLTTCMPFINKFHGDVFGQCWWNQYYMLYDFSGYPGYLVLGHYIRYHIDWSTIKRRTVGLTCLTGGTAFTILSFYIQAEPGTPQLVSDLEIAWCFCIINCVVATFGAFLLFTTIKRECFGYGLVKDMSIKSYGMYLMHMLWLPFWVSVVQPHMNVGVAIPLISILTFVSCYITSKLISYIPKSKWIIG